jgi:negative regulator of flagellin synthesis FlgM
MKVPSVGSLPETSTVTTVSTAVAPAKTVAATTSSPAAAAPPLESAILGAALAAMQELPEIDQVKVATLRNALEHGQIPFDASKLAALIDRYHRTEQ